MPTLTDRVTNFIQRLRPPAETTQVTGYECAGRGIVDLAKVFRDAGTRREVVQACNEMYSGDPRAEAIVNRVADGAVRRGVSCLRAFTSSPLLQTSYFPAPDVASINSGENTS
jgi:hypothetical protein